MTINNLQIPYPDFEMGQVIDPEQTDLNNRYLENKINEVIRLINKVTDSVEAGGSGADLISLTPIAPFTSNKVQAFLNEVITRLRSTADGVSGADFVASTTITGVTGNTVQAQLKSLKDLFDAEKARVTNAMTAETTRVNKLVNDEIISVKNLITTERNRINTLNTTVTGHGQNISTLNTQMTNHTHDTRYMTRAELTPYLQGGDTLVHIESYTIVSSNNGDGTFTYTDKDNNILTGSIGESGEQIFEIKKDYSMNLNHMKAIIGDTLHRSVASGGLKEISRKRVALTMPEGIGTEVTFEYFQRLGVSGEHNIVYSATQPPPTSGSTMWFKVVG